MQRKRPKTTVQDLVAKALQPAPVLSHRYSASLRGWSM